MSAVVRRPCQNAALEEGVELALYELRQVDVGGGVGLGDGAAGRWLAHEAPEVVTSSALRPGSDR